MLEFFRTHGKPLQFLLLLVIIIAFVFVGVEGYVRMADSANLTVAKVGGGDIKQSELDQAHREQVQRMQQQMPGVDLKLFDTPEMKSRTLDALVRDRVMSTAVVKEHLVVTNERLDRSFKNDPQFASIRAADGTISKEFLSARGLTSAGFAQQLRDDMAKRQVMEGVTSSQLAGQTVTSAATTALLEQREVQFQPFMSMQLAATLNPTDADLEAYYKDHQSQFFSEEEARIEYVLLDLEALKKQVTLGEDDLRKYYEQNIKLYTAPEERHAAHILVNAPKDMAATDREKAKAKAEGLLAEARKNAAGFAELAKKSSDDKGSAINGGDLDFFGRGAMVKPFEDAAFSMKPGEISNLVESEFGFHIIKLIAARGGEPKPFDVVRAQIVEEVSRPKAQELYAAAAEQFTNMVYEQADSLQPVIDKLKLTKAEAVVKRQPQPGATGPLASPKLLEEVFSSDAVQNKRNTSAVETGTPNQLVAARIIEHRPARVLPLAEVRERVVAAVKTQQAAALAKKEGEARVAALKKSPEEAMAQPAVVVSRTDGQKQPRPVIEAVLRADISKGPAVIGVDLGDQGYVVARVIKRVDRAPNDPRNEDAKNFITQSLAAAETEAYYDALKRRYKVKVEKAVGAAEAASAASK
jgi:peptidyl-prolyl cis-trans isomerase D